MYYVASAVTYILLTVVDLIQIALVWCMVIVLHNAGHATAHNNFYRHALIHLIYLNLQ